MKDPRPVSSLAEAAQWMTETTLKNWTDKEVLDFAFRKMLSETIVPAITLQSGCEAPEMAKRVLASFPPRIRPKAPQSRTLRH